MSSAAPPPYRLSVAPMMDRTDRHFRYVLRQITRRTLLYSEMVTARAVLHGDVERLLGFSAIEGPLVLQLGGDRPAELAAAARLGAALGYDEINLNVGCPSERVQQGRFGACLMAEPALVAECVAALRGAVGVPVTVKHRIGISGHEGYDALTRFVATVAEAGCARFDVHARLALLDGLSPKANRTVPPLRYDVVYQLKRDFPRLCIVLNGGLRTLAEAQSQLAHVDGAMIGRAAYDDPYLLARADRLFFAGTDPVPTRRAVIEALLPYVAALEQSGQPGTRVTRHLLGLLTGRPGARRWRTALSASDGATATERLRALLLALPAAVLDET
ncbi:MAG: tRNA dihydrouridine(20/20a) synthase DusA [Proteobacteria bacterium]|nr:tRNA dihydrouridine(20/20a) synthase DusA [Pseudomonadota bacterium]